MATQAKRPRVSGGRGVQPFPPRLTPSPFAEPSACAPSAPSRGSRAPLRSSPPPPKARSALAPRSPAVPSGLSGGRTWSLRALISGGGARGRRRPGSCGLLPELVPAGGAGAESQGERASRRAEDPRRGAGCPDQPSSCSGGGQPAGHGGRLRHGGPGERAGRRAAVRGAAGRAPVAAHLLHPRPAGARWARRRARALERGGAGRGGPGPRGRAGALTPVSSSERVALQSQSGWVPLLLALLHELQAPASRWRPYFALWPELGRLEHPMFW